MHIAGRKNDSIREKSKKAQASRDRLFAGRLTLALVVVAALFGFARSFAQVSPRPGVDNALTQILLDLEDVRIHAERIQILSRYCKPPLEPNKSETQADIDLELLVLRTLLRDFYRVQQMFIAAGTTPTGMSFIASFPVINGVPHTAPTYWPVAKGMFTQVQNVLTKKQQQLNDAPERDCAPQQAKQEPVKDSKPPPDPLAGLTRPVPRDITFPQVPAYFCHEFLRRQWYLDNFAPEWNEAADNAADASTYRAEVSKRGTEHANKGGDPAQQRRLDAEERWSDDNYKQHTRVSDRTETFRRRIFNTPVIDCSPRSLADYLESLRNQVMNVDAEIKQAKAKIEEIEDLIRSILMKDDLLDAYEYGVLWGVDPVTTEHHNVLQSVYEAQQHQSSLEKEIDKLSTQKSVLQEQLNRTTKFIDNFQKADANQAGTPRFSAEPVQNVEEKKPGFFESLIPALIPSIGIGIGGGTDRERRHPANPCAGKK
jgi:hypothetical protein